MPDAYLDATAQAELVRRGEASPAELVEEAITRIEKVNPEINAVVIPLFEKARAEAATAPDGPFRGVPYVIKDLVVVSKGDPHSGAIIAMKDADYRPDYDSYFVQRMREAGFVLVGKANTPEMGIQPTTEPLSWGPTRNPWDPTRSAGASSGGSAAAVGAAIVPVAHGNDGGGSVRMPASLCGVVGIKPTRGRISSGPQANDIDCVFGMAHEGLMARSVRDIAGMLDVVSGRYPGEPFYLPPPARPFTQEVGADPGRLRIGVLAHDPTGSFEIDPECAAGARAAADVLAGLGHDVSDSFPSALTKGTWPLEFMTCVDVQIMRMLDHYGEVLGRPITEDDVEAPTWGFYDRGRTVTAAAFSAGIDSLRRQAADIETWWEIDGWDLLVTPTSGRKQPLIGEVKATAEVPDPPDAESLLAFTVPYNVSGQPAMTLPVYWSTEGLPLGVQLVAAYGREDVLLRAAAQLEAAMPWADRRPQVGA
jgi:Asp-tRNA(Asn)/Glu-tRNA(Gln) amidotransferase A subunit family amidase